MISFSRLARFMRLIIVKGKFRQSGPDFQQSRIAALKDLDQFCPPNHARSADNAKKPRNPFVLSLHSQAAYIKGAFKRQGGHLSLPDRKLCYIRNPKAASTALAYAMLSARYPRLQGVALSPDKINFLADVNLDLQLPSAQSEFVFFTAVRNPFSRIVSVYREFFERQGDHFIYEDYLFGILGKQDTFKQFLTAVHMIPDILKDQHLKPQHALLACYERKGVDVKVLKLEEPGSIAEFLLHYGLTWKTINKSEPYDYRSYFDPETLEIACQLYQQDISRFGYQGAALELRHRVAGKQSP